MRIVSIVNHCCIRAVKEAIVLGQKDIEVHLISKLMPNYEMFSTKTKFDTKDHIVGAIKLFNESDIFHVHNEPCWYVSMVREIYPKARIVYDVHDSNYWRTDEKVSWYEDDVASELCDAYVFPSERAKDKYPRKEDKPAIVIPSANAESEFTYGPWSYVGGLISQGGHVILEREGTNLESWRDYSELYTALKDKKQVLAASPQFEKGDQDLDEYYTNTGATINGKLDHWRLLQRMGCFDWSLCGNLGESPVWQIARPNKFYDAMAAGVPVMNINVPEIADTINEYGVGVNVSSVEELLENWDCHIEKRGNVLKNRKYLTMDVAIQPLIELYEKL